MFLGLLKFISTLSLIVLVSCQNNVKDVNEANDQATFELGQVEVVAFATNSSNPNWPELKDRAVVDLKVCILDRVYLTDLAGEDFEITSDLTSEESSSDAKGCITWQEQFEFDFTADETFYKLTGTIRGTSDYKGAKNYKLALNPWTQKIIDLDYGTAPKIKSIFSKRFTKSIKNQLEIDEYDIAVIGLNFDNNNHETRLKLEVSTSPDIIRKNLDSRKKSIALSNGKFQTDFVLFQREKGTNRRTELARANPTDVINDEGKLQSQIEFVIKQSIDYQSIIELVIRTRPVENHLAIGSNEGYMVIGSLLKPTEGTLSDLPISFNQLIALSASNKSSKSLSLDKRINGTHGFIIDSIIGKPITEEGANLDYSRTDRHIKSEIELTLVDTLVFDGINSNFEVELIDMTNEAPVHSEIKYTKSKKGTGKLIITPTIDFGDDYEYNYRDYKLTVRGTKAPFKGITQERIVYINPRLKGRAFLIDSADGDKPKVDVENQPEIFLREFSFDFLGNDEANSYKVNKDLELVSNRIIRLTMFPKLLLKHNFDKTQDNPPKIQTGEYKVSFMLLTPNKPLIQSYDRNLDLKDFHVITGDQIKVNSEAGKITADISLPHLFGERLLMSYKNIAVLLIEPIDKNSLVQPGFMMGAVQILSKKGVVTPLVDSRLKTGHDVALAQNNQQLIKLFSNKMKEFKHKLIPDHEISDPFKNFKNDLLNDRVSQQVDVIDHENYKLAKKEVKFDVFDTEDDFITTNKLKLPISDVNNMILTGKASDDQLKDLCSLFYDPKQVTEVIYKSNPIFGSATSKTVKHRGEEYQRCRRAPLAHITIKDLRFMKNILQQPRQLMDRFGDQAVTERANELIRSEAFFKSKGVVHSEIEGTRATNFVGGSIHTALEKTVGMGPMRLFFAAGPDIGTRTDHYSTKQSAEILSDQRRLINQDGQKYLVDSVKVEFEAKVKKCVMISPKFILDTLPTRIVDAKKGIDVLLKRFEKHDGRVLVTSPKRVVVCNKMFKNEFLSDEWFFIRLASTGHEGMADYSMAKNSVGSIVRGEQSYLEFRMLDLKNDQQVIIDTDSNEEVITRYKKHFHRRGHPVKYKSRLGTGYPGLIE